mmetsp:Transcript_43274/g.123821  ORF Transcript_43274/g.123821 Transcript_43274/m.123821 type:complete len:352 (-) Transcript_43274:47-1102(-)
MVVRMALRQVAIVPLILSSCVLGAACSANPAKFLIVSAPREGKISYMRVQRGGSIKRVGTPADSEMKVLIGSGLVHPQGLAVEQVRQQLLVADPDAQKIWSYPLISSGGTLSVGSPTVLAENTEARWVAVDGSGNIFFSDEPRNQILKITREQALVGNSTPAVVYDGTALTQVSSPGGLAVDSFHAFWVNKQSGTQVGSVVRGPAGQTGRALLQVQDQHQNAQLQRIVPLSKNSDKSYGLCLAMNNVYYTQPESIVFGIKKMGSEAVTVTNRLKNPRGCAWDGDGTVYVADRGAGAVYSFAGNMRELSAVQISKTVDFEDAFGVAVFSGASTGGLSSVAALVVALAAPLLM